MTMINDNPLETLYAPTSSPSPTPPSESFAVLVNTSSPPYPISSTAATKRPSLSTSQAASLLSPTKPSPGTSTVSPHQPFAGARDALGRPSAANAGLKLLAVTSVTETVDASAPNRSPSDHVSTTLPHDINNLRPAANHEHQLPPFVQQILLPNPSSTTSAAPSHFHSPSHSTGSLHRKNKQPMKKETNQPGVHSNTFVSASAPHSQRPKLKPQTLATPTTTTVKKTKGHSLSSEPSATADWQAIVGHLRDQMLQLHSERERDRQVYQAKELEREQRDHHIMLELQQTRDHLLTVTRNWQQQWDQHNHQPMMTTAASRSRHRSKSADRTASQAPLNDRSPRRRRPLSMRLPTTKHPSPPDPSRQPHYHSAVEDETQSADQPYSDSPLSSNISISISSSSDTEAIAADPAMPSSSAQPTLSATLPKSQTHRHAPSTLSTSTLADNDDQFSSGSLSDTSHHPPSHQRLRGASSRRRRQSKRRSSRTRDQDMAIGYPHSFGLPPPPVSSLPLSYYYYLASQHLPTPLPLPFHPIDAFAMPLPLPGPPPGASSSAATHGLWPLPPPPPHMLSPPLAPPPASMPSRSMHEDKFTSPSMPPLPPLLPASLNSAHRRRSTNDDDERHSLYHHHHHYHPPRASDEDEEDDEAGSNENTNESYTSSLPSSRMRSSLSSYLPRHHLTSRSRSHPRPPPFDAHPFSSTSTSHLPHRRHLPIPAAFPPSMFSRE
ncbi:hypothetical protein DM01DRAFT_1406130 [Hesseltinella vesiculosa]|uniref:Uncharacterized protein n=1 Tax=Hesseltinella vesiculosa TaxID=101127 RepID=A0A1X2GNF7_9FUNG|nr:hypothetical protein DM01DRAFT_1406130 [Hesseltinella vesiculosa]